MKKVQLTPKENTRITLSFVENFRQILTNIYKNKKRNKTMLTMLQKIEPPLEKSFNTWKGLNYKQQKKVAKVIYNLEQNAFQKQCPMVVYAAFLIALLSDLAGKLNQYNAAPKKLELIDSLLNQMVKFYKYFEKNKNINQYNEEATLIYLYWKNIVEV